jgi:hypothetical protein
MNFYPVIGLVSMSFLAVFCRVKYRIGGVSWFFCDELGGFVSAWVKSQNIPRAVCCAAGPREGREKASASGMQGLILKPEGLMRWLCCALDFIHEGPGPQRGRAVILNILRFYCNNKAFSLKEFHLKKSNTHLKNPPSQRMSSHS